MIDTHKFAMFLSEFRKSSRQISTTQVKRCYWLLLELII